MSLLKKFVKDDRGVSAIEYGLLATLIAVAIIVGATALGNALDAKFSSVATTVTNGK
ncbi:MAG: Flp family type IVb pilin [Burkholderiaceae bacterium]|nr:Flp family type IVb pilin [Burkholderiaceae bacterium]